MKFGGIGIPELIIILVVVLLIFGPKNLPKLGSALGRTMKNLREGMSGNKDGEEEAADEEVEGELEDEDVEVEEQPAPKKKVVKKKASTDEE